MGIAERLRAGSSPDEQPRLPVALGSGRFTLYSLKGKIRVAGNDATNHREFKAEDGITFSVWAISAKTLPLIGCGQYPTP